MRRLILLRHAKSDWPDGVPDSDRPLSRRGREAAPRMAAYLAEEGLRPDHALVSPARRTQETWSLVAPALPGAAQETVPALYEASAKRLLDVVRGADDAVATLLLLGHNPGLQEFGQLLLADEDRDGLRALSRKFPTAAVAVIDLAVGAWAEVAPHSGTLERFITPKALGAGEDD
ncbi:putative phosphohistidine phosphatase, SixA [Methylobacterium sp. 4-46]|uniref:SixA phosphatase family protein n=1 Tax=unclassified Methylobacterium TaxID=2615210 RepID=UPI000152DFB4|nr:MULTISPECIES: histidine phosphatase family protein [Methylobacterium]ACA20481.1 putative phosphohistidine phosphatase, SixA [Methylobacterium sp. 4-46]WFT79648.1 histidine phosphatase family protein [Methylobacterium nodulans]